MPRRHPPQMGSRPIYAREQWGDGSLASASLAMEEKEVAEARHVGSMHMPKPFIKSHPIEQQEGDCLHVNTTNDNAKTELARFFHWNPGLKGVSTCLQNINGKNQKRREAKWNDSFLGRGKKKSSQLRLKAITTTAGQRPSLKTITNHLNIEVFRSLKVSHLTELAR